MNQWTKTAIFGSVALLCVVLAVASRPRPVGPAPDQEIGQPLFKDFTDPLAVRSLEILYVDPDVSARGSGSDAPSYHNP